MDLSEISSSSRIGDEYQKYLNDEAKIVDDGHADRIYFPKSTEEIITITKTAFTNKIPVTVSGGGTGLSGGRVPFGGWIIATDELTSISSPHKIHWSDPESGRSYYYNLTVENDKIAYLTVPPSITLQSVQNLCRELGWFYPPDPTERSSYIGGNVATNASGARSFKFGATREWIWELDVVLPNGNLIHLSREGDGHTIENSTIVLNADNREYNIPLPSYDLPDVNKNVAGPVLTNESEPIDLFIGTEGIFGIIGEVTLKLRRPPGTLISMFVYTETKEKALDVINLCKKLREENREPIPVSVEYMGQRAVNIMKKHDSNIPALVQSLVMIEIEAINDDEMFAYLESIWNDLESIGILDTSVAQSHQEIEHHKSLRHMVPETVNSIVKGHGQSKLGTDYSVPKNKFEELFYFAFEMGEKMESYQVERDPFDTGEFGYAFWCHAGDSHIHLNLLPRNDDETKFAKSILIEIIDKVIELGGSIAAEHGVGKKKFGEKLLLKYQYGESVIDEIKDMKRVIDPHDILNRGNLIGDL